MPERDESAAPDDTSSTVGDGVAGVDASYDADETLVGARGLARSALLEVTPEHTIGPDAGHTVEGEHVLSLRFSSRLDGYVGWFWTVTIARVDDEAPTVLEISMMPGDGALTAPDWVPWSERLADYRASQEAAEAAAGDVEGLDDDDDIDESDLDEDDDLDIDESTDLDDESDDDEAGGEDDDDSDDDDLDDDRDDDDDDLDDDTDELTR